MAAPRLPPDPALITAVPHSDRVPGISVSPVTEAAVPPRAGTAAVVHVPAE
jgi:hypothetical protein